MISNNSRADTFERCNREYALSYELYGTGLIPYYMADYFADGIATHAGLAEYYSRSPLDVVNSAIYEEYQRLQETPRSEDIVWAQTLIKSYSERDEPKDTFEPLEVETEFKVQLGEVCYSCGKPYVRDDTRTTCPACGAAIHWWVGRIDLSLVLIGSDPERDGFAILDHKTTKSNVNSSYIAAFNHSFQLIGYSYGYAKYNNTKVGQYGVNVFKKLKRVEPYPVNCANCKGTGQLKTKACSKCGASGVIIKEPKQLFIRKWFNYTPAKEDRFVFNRLITLNRIEEEKKKFDNLETRGESFPMNPKACHMMRSGGSCIFADTVCWNPTVRADKWWDISEAQLAQTFSNRPKDYVTLAEEEID